MTCSGHDGTSAARLRPRSRRRDGDRGRRPPRRTRRHHHRCRQRAARANHPQRPRHARSAGSRRSGALRQPLVLWSPSRSAAAFVHGDSGLDGADLPAPTTPLDGIDAVGFIVDTCRTLDDVWLVPVGPLTNIALALRRRSGHRRSHRRHLADGRRNLRQPHADGRVQRLGRSRGRDDRVRLRRPARHGGPRRDTPVPGHARTDRHDRRARLARSPPCSPTCSASSARHYLRGTTPVRSRRRRPRPARGVRGDASRAVRPDRAPRRHRDPRRAHPRDDRDRSSERHLLGAAPNCDVLTDRRRRRGVRPPRRRDRALSSH